MGAFNPIKNPVSNIPLVGPAIAGGQTFSSKGDNAERKFQEQMAGLDPGQRPDAPQYSNLLDPQTGMLKSQYQLANADAFKQASQNQINDQTTAGRDLAQNLSQTQAAQAQSNLASHGGLMGGAAERLANQASRTAAEQQQLAQRQGTQNTDQLGVTAENMNRQAQQFNIGNATEEQARQDALKASQYQQQMQNYAAGKQAQGILQAGQTKGQSGGLGGGLAKTVGK